MHGLLNCQQRMPGRACLVLTCRAAGAHGWNTDNSFASSVDVPASLWGRLSVDAGYIGILLGPERTRECFFLAGICRQGIVSISRSGGDTVLV